MKPTRRIIWAVAALLLLSGVAPATANAQGLASEKTYFTFSHAVELPGGVVLQPGKYNFKLADTSGSRHVVQVFNEDETKLIATMLTVSAESIFPASYESVVTFAEAPAGSPQPLRFWYYAGRKTGHEFVYSKDQAQRIAKATKSRVLMTEAAATDAKSLNQAEIRAVEPSGATAEFKSGAPAKTAQKQGVRRTATRQTAAVRAKAKKQVPAPTADNQQAPSARSRPDEIAAESQTARNQLSATASFDPLVGLIGLMSLGAFLALRMVRS